ncbi:hypothetical protein EHQ53_07880 [Leptospira langatensis]|uniref:Uncharacterized protein n=1 Tax=Leptospira langatensis TaxID=2484983 RepID=A0A5F1ZXX7_9LEPT|nr:hypothetical protein EHO57_10990 [Leptospira langatensis]TGL42437.1 hypothetical protein EHQ53_07880 [Leptospira langatensis]
MVSIPFLPSEWVDAVFFSPVPVLSSLPKLKKELFSSTLVHRLEDPYCDLGLRFEYTIRQFSNLSSDKNAESLGKSLRSSFRLKLVRIYDYNFRSMYSSDPEGPAFHSGLRLLGLEVPRSGWEEDTEKFLLYRSANGELYFQIPKEDGERIVQESTGAKSTYLPREFSEGVLYWAFRKTDQGYELLETNLDPMSPLLPEKTKESIDPTQREGGEVETHALLEKFSKPGRFLQRPVWEKMIQGNMEIFLAYPRKSRAQEMLLILAAISASLLSLLGGILASRILYTIRAEKRYSEREDTLKMKTELVRLLGLVRERTR